MTGIVWDPDDVRGDSLYEFEPRPGVHVRLHDSRCTEIRLDPLARRLRLRFEVVPEWRSGATAASYAFEDVTVFEWTDRASAEPIAEHDRSTWPGDVGLFDWDDAWIFWLCFSQLSIWFEAGSAAVEVELDEG